MDKMDIDFYGKVALQTGAAGTWERRCHGHGSIKKGLIRSGKCVTNG